MDKTRTLSGTRAIAAIGGCVLATFAIPAQAATPRDAVGIDVGYAHSCAVTSCGEVKCWGRNDWGQSTDLYPSTRYTFFYQAPFEQVSVGQYHTCALDEDDGIVCTGKNNYGQVAEPSGAFVDLDAGYNHNCALDTSGSAVCWGANDTKQSAAPAGAYKDISAGRQHSCAVTSNGEEVRCWGSNAYGQARSVHSYELVTGELFREVSAGAYHTCALTESSRVYCWGSDTYEAVSGGGIGFDQGDGIYKFGQAQWRGVSAGTYGTLGVFQDGPNSTYNEIWGWGWPWSQTYFPPAYPPSAPAQVSAGHNHACYIDLAGDVTCYGDNSYGKSTPDDVGGSCGRELRLIDFPLDPG